MRRLLALVSEKRSGWYGVDLDGTLARYDGWVDKYHIGEPIEPMVKLVKGWLAEGKDVRIFTARANRPEPKVIASIERWCRRHLGAVLPVTCTKDYGMIVLYDDRAVQVECNTGRLIVE